MCPVLKCAHRLLNRDVEAVHGCCSQVKGPMPQWVEVAEDLNGTFRDAVREQNQDSDGSRWLPVRVPGLTDISLGHALQSRDAPLMRVALGHTPSPGMPGESHPGVCVAGPSMLKCLSQSAAA